VDISNLVADLSTFKESLSQFQSHLESQRAATIKGQFREFSQSLGIVADAETINNLFESFEDISSTLEDNQLKLRDRILKTLDSQFVAQILTLKTAARESELRRMTSDLSDFIRDIPATSNDSQFIQNLMAKSLKTLATEASLQKNLGKTYNEAWINSLQEQAEEIFKNF
jgi:hypothetical protein|tara:strand:- start:301 stop:810 length:510 start_codon:yes stop_codon:yes gene_type:complete